MLQRTRPLVDGDIVLVANQAAIGGEPPNKVANLGDVLLKWRHLLLLGDALVALYDYGVVGVLVHVLDRHLLLQVQPLVEQVSVETAVLELLVRRVLHYLLLFYHDAFVCRAWALLAGLLLRGRLL